MSVVVTAKLQQDIKLIMEAFVVLRNDALDLYNLYWKGGVSSEVSSLPNPSDPASYNARLTKAQLGSGLTLVDQMGNIFFENGSVTTGDYLATCETSLYGNATPTLVSVAVEGYANRLVQFARDCITQYNRCRNAETFYGASKIYDAVNAIDSETVVMGADMTKSELLAAITVIHQFQLFLQNSAVTAGYYRTTLAQWGRF